MSVLPGERASMPGGNLLPGFGGRKKFSKNGLILGAFGLSGAAALIYEVVWVRALSLVLGSTVYALSTILCAFMAGLSLGAYLGGLWADRARNPLSVFAFLELGIALCGLFTLSIVRGLSPLYAWIFYAFHLSFHSFSLVQFFLAFGVMILPTTLMGATFPVVCRIVTPSWERLGKGAGSAYSINSLGAILGSFSAGFILLPLLGMKSANLLAALMNLGIGLFILIPSPAPWKTRFFAGMAPLCLIPLGLASIQGPNSMPIFNYYWAHRYGSYAEFKQVAQRSRLLFEEEGAEGIVQVWDGGGRGTNIYLVNGGKIEGSTRMDLTNQLLLAYLPWAAMPRAKSFLNIGLGTGTTLRAAARLDRLERLDCVEINPSVLRAVKRYFYPELFSDPRILFILADARNYLMLTKQRYDIISSEPSYPTDESVSHLFTREFFERVRARLTEGGVFAQWIPYHLLSHQDTRMMVKTFARVFPRANVWHIPASGDIILLGAISGPLEAGQVIQRRVEEKLRGEEGFGREAIAGFVLGRSEEEVRRYAAREDVPINTDDRPLLEFAAARNLFSDSQELHSPP